MGSLFVLPRFTPINGSGRPYSGCKLYIYRASTSTLASIYEDSGLTSYLTNPVVADSNGQLPAIYLEPNTGYNYRVVLKTSADVELWAEDDVPAGSITSDDVGRSLYPRTTEEIAASVTPTNYCYPPLNVHRYGAVGDGSTDDSLAFLSARNVANVAGGFVGLEANTYKVAQQVLFSVSNTGMIGKGWASCIKVDSSATRFIPILAQNLSTPMRGVTFRDFCIDGNGKGLLDAGLLQINNAIGFLVDHIYVKNAGTAAEASPSGVNGITVSVGSLGNTGSQGTIRDCLVEACTKAGINVSTESTNIQVIGNIVRNCTGNGETPGIQVLGGYQTTVIGNAVSGCEGNGILVGSTGSGATLRVPRQTTITGNQITGCGTGSTAGSGIFVTQDGAQSDALGRVVIADNIIDTPNTAYNGFGIYVVLTDEVAITGNIVRKARSAGIRIQSCRAVRVHGNVVTDNNTANQSDQSGVQVYTTGSNVIDQLSVVGNTFRNNAGEHQKYPIFFDGSNPAASITNFEFFDNSATGHETRDFPLCVLPKKTALKHVFDYSTTDAGPNNGGYFTLEDEAAYMIRLSVVAKKSDTSDRAAYERTALVYRDGGGSATVQGSVASVVAVESNAAWDATIGVTSNLATFSLTGAAATTISWRIAVEVLSV